ncbi:DUF3800 domain-containing protein [Mesorhizobium sp. ZC-5]|uniref:DUF3800 domain-containing protein n=1 Tax=Mesorhizobium sp. ZC-5 TaxID=2986066 RepID=UPI0021E87848|nr:DUF3800 domain-containing protein [Mesorhizobium sp. ZC-5]MCV3239219.1 DUF3800 domain-containing protein [Mesorhizobium sp. ZC-5]
MAAHGDYIFYADESGDHSLTSIDPAYPAFSLSLCAFRKSDYCSRIIPSFLSFKFKYFGHDAIVLHEREIRKQTGAFTFLVDLRTREAFMEDLTALVGRSRFAIFAAVIDKHALKLDLFPSNPYGISLRICLQSAFRYLEKRGQIGLVHHFIFEKRGTKEDQDLELEFRRIVDGANDLRIRFPEFNIHFSDKRTNSTGMQIADLTARPIGLKIVRPTQANRSYDAIAMKLNNYKRFARPSSGVYAP